MSVSFTGLQQGSDCEREKENEECIMLLKRDAFIFRKTTPKTRQELFRLKGTSANRFFWAADFTFMTAVTTKYTVIMGHPVSVLNCIHEKTKKS